MGIDVHSRKNGLGGGGFCMLFKEVLEEKESYGARDGLLRCFSCLRIEEKQWKHAARII